MSIKKLCSDTASLINALCDSMSLDLAVEESLGKLKQAGMIDDDETEFYRRSQLSALGDENAIEKFADALISDGKQTKQKYASFGSSIDESDYEDSPNLVKGNIQNSFSEKVKNFNY